MGILQIPSATKPANTKFNVLVLNRAVTESCYIENILHFVGILQIPSATKPTNTKFNLFVCFVALHPKSTAMVMAGRSVHLTTLFPGQA